MDDEAPCSHNVLVKIYGLAAVVSCFFVYDICIKTELMLVGGLQAYLLELVNEYF